MSFDVDAVRSSFPALRAGAAHFDAPGGSQVPTPVAEAVAATLTAPIANRGRLTRAERISDDSAVDFAGERLRGQVRLRQVCRTQTTIEITVVRV